MSGHPPPNIEPKGTIEDATAHFHSRAAYKTGVLFKWMEQRYPGCRRYDKVQDGDLASAKEMQRIWTLDIAKGRGQGQAQWGVGAAERGEIFVRTNAEGQKEFILPAIPMDVAWANGPFNADLRGWLPCRPGSDIHSGVLACPAFILHNRRGGYTVLPELDNFVKEWKDGKKSSLEHPFGLKVQPRGQHTTYEWQYDCYPLVDERLSTGELTPPAISTWTCRDRLAGLVDEYIFDLELTRKIEELARQQAHIPVSRPGAA